MLITGIFKDLDDNTITVNIYNRDKVGNNITIGNTDLDDVYFASDPISIETQCDDSFTHVMKRSCTISVITKIYLGDYLFANNMRSIIVNVFKNDDCIFAGYVTPNTYSQGYSNVYEQLDIQCIDVLSTMQYEYLCSINNYESEKSMLELSQFSSILEQVDLTRTDNIISNYPVTEMGTEIWVETWFEKVGGAYYAIETKLIKLDNDTAITTNVTRRGRMLEITSKNGELDDPVIINGKKHYKRYMWVTINGTDEINTGDWFPGNEMPEPQETQVVWEVTGVVRLNPNYYVTNEIGTAILDDGSTIPNYAHRYGDNPLPYTLVYDTISNTMHSGSHEYLNMIPCVTYDNKKYYFPEDAEAGLSLLDYYIFVETPTNEVNPDRGTHTLIGQTINNTYLHGIDISDSTDYSSLFADTDIIKIVTINPVNYLDCGSFCMDCHLLEYARIDTYSFADIGYIFYDCPKLANILLNVTDAYNSGEYIDFDGLPLWVNIYVHDDTLNDYTEPPFDIYNLLPISELDIIPLNREMIPMGYTEMTMITNPSTAYVNTGVRCNSNNLLKLETMIRFNEIPSAAKYIGCANNFFGHNDTGYWANSGTSSRTDKPVRRTKYNVMLNRTATNRITCTIDNNILINSTRSIGTDFYDVILFNYNTNTNSAVSCSLGRTKIYLNDVLQKDLIPCKNRKNVYGFYDIVNGNFLTSGNNINLTGE